MNTRCLLLPVILVAMCLSSGCAGDGEAPRADDTPKAGDLPQAPPPRAKKTAAELLVGKWNRVTFLGKPLKPGSAVLNEFTQDGKFTFTITNRGTGQEVNTGVYRVTGNTIRLTSDDAPDYPSKTWEITIESINETELATASGPPTEIQRSTYKRVEKKTPAELLVGKWNRVKFFDKPQKPGVEVLLEFTHDGKFTFTTTTPKTGQSVKTGVYRMVGNTIRVTADATAEEPSKTWEITIESINETELATASGPPTERQRSVYKRVEKQK